MEGGIRSALSFMTLVSPPASSAPRVLLRSTRLLSDELETPGTCSFFGFHEAFAAHIMVFLLHLNFAQGERGLQLQSKKTQVASLRQCILSGGLRSAPVAAGCHDVGMIKNHRDANEYILALLRKPDRFGNG